MNIFVITLLLISSINLAFSKEEVFLESQFSTPKVIELTDTNPLLRNIVVDSGLLNNPLTYYVFVVRKTKDRYTILRFYAKQVANPENQEFMMKSDDYVWIRSRDSALNVEQGLHYLPDKIRIQIEKSTHAFKYFAIDTTNKNAEQDAAPNP